MYPGRHSPRSRRNVILVCERLWEPSSDFNRPLTRLRFIIHAESKKGTIRCRSKRAEARVSRGNALIQIAVARRKVSR